MPDDIPAGWVTLRAGKDSAESPFLKVKEIGGIADHVAAKLILDLEERVKTLEQKVFVLERGI